VTDPDPGGRSPRSPYARPEPDAVTEERSYLVDPSPEEFGEPAKPKEAKPSAPPFESSISGTGAVSAPGMAALASGGAASAVASGVVLGAASDEPRRPVRILTAARGPRRTRLVVKHIDPWTVMKISFVVSLVMLAVVVVAVAIIYAVLGKMGVWTQINTLVNEVSPTTTSKALRNPLSGSRVVGIAAVIGGINVVLLTALSTLGAAIYNLISDLVGGVEVTLTDP
jgi:hypothetical protein